MDQQVQMTKLIQSVSPKIFQQQWIFLSKTLGDNKGHMRSVHKIRWIFKFHGLCTFDFRFFSYVGTLVPNVCSQFQQYSIFCLFVRGIKIRSVLRVLAIFCCRKKMDPRICIKFCVKNGIKCSKTLEMLKVAYDECTVSQKTVYKWCKFFTEGREEVNDDTQPGRPRPSTSTTSKNTEAVKKIVIKNRWITIREIAEDIGISVDSCHAIFSDILGLKRMAAKFVPKLLNFGQKTRLMTIA